MLMGVTFCHRLLHGFLALKIVSAQLFDHQGLLHSWALSQKQRTSCPLIYAEPWCFLGNKFMVKQALLFLMDRSDDSNLGVLDDL